jgi:putative transposase
VKYAFIQSHLSEYCVQACCQMLEVSRSGYYDWIDRPVSEQAKHQEDLKVKIKKAHEENRRVYGSRRVCAVLRANVKSHVRTRWRS